MNFPILNPAQRHQIHIVLSAHHSNPNGDPDNDNAPRINPFTGHGLITAVSLKRKARDYVQAAYSGQEGMEIFIRHGEVMGTVAMGALSDAGVQVAPTVPFSPEDIATLLDHDLPEDFDVTETGIAYKGTLKKADITNLIVRLKLAAIDPDLVSRVEQLTTQKPEKADRRKLQEDARPIMARRFWDARLFGYTAPDSAGKTRGPVQITDAESLAPVNLIEQVVTRVARSQSSDKDGNGNFGRRTVVDHAVYVATAHHSPALAAQQGVTSQDLTALLEGLWYGQEEARSSARPDIRVEALVVVSHESPYGNAPTHQLTRRLQVTHDGRQEVDVTFDQTDLPQGVQVQIVR